MCGGQTVDGRWGDTDQRGLVCRSGLLPVLFCRSPGGCWGLERGVRDQAGSLCFRPPQNSLAQHGLGVATEVEVFGCDSEGSRLHPPVQREDLPFPLEKKHMQRRSALRTGLLPSQCSFLQLSLRPFHCSFTSRTKSLFQSQNRNLDGPRNSSLARVPSSLPTGRGTVVRSPRNERVTECSLLSAAAFWTQ